MPNVRILLLTIGCLLGTACTDTPNVQTHVGYVEADWIYVAAPQSGWLTARAVEEGDHVTVGQLLFELDSEKEKAGLAEIDGRIEQSLAEARNVATGARPTEIRALEALLAEANARLAQSVSERDRILALIERGLETPNRAEQVIANALVFEAAVAAAQENINVARLAGRAGTRDAAQAKVATARAERASAQINLDERTVRSRADGKVEDVFQHPGEFVTVGSPVLALLRQDGLKIRFFVTQAELPELVIGKVVKVTADGKPAATNAVVSYIATEAEFTPPVIYSREARDKLVFLIEATLPAATGFHPGLPVDVDWT